MIKESAKMNLQLGDPEENVNLAVEPDMQLTVADLSARLRAGWRAEASDSALWRKQGIREIKVCKKCIWGMSGASSWAFLGQSKISAVLHASLMPFFG